MARLEGLEWEWTYLPHLGVSFVVLFVVWFYIPAISENLSTTYKDLSYNKKIIWGTYFYSLIHAILMSVLSVFALISSKELWTDPIWCNSPIVRASCAICVGYMLFDLYILVKHLSVLGDWFFVLHHVATIYAYLTVVLFGVLPFFAIYRLLAEISTPFVDLRWMFDAVGYSKTSPQNMINGVLMTLSFFLVRILAMPYFWYIVYTVYGTEDFNRLGNIQLILVTSCFILDFINIAWFYKMCRGVKKVIALKLDANKNEIPALQKSE